MTQDYLKQKMRRAGADPERDSIRAAVIAARRKLVAAAKECDRLLKLETDAMRAESGPVTQAARLLPD